MVLIDCSGADGAYLSMKMFKRLIGAVVLGLVWLVPTAASAQMT